MHHFYLQCPPSHNILILGMLSISYLHWRVGHLLLSLLLSLLGRLLIFKHLVLKSIVLI